MCSLLLALRISAWESEVILVRVWSIRVDAAWTQTGAQRTIIAKIDKNLVTKRFTGHLHWFDAKRKESRGPAMTNRPPLPLNSSILTNRYKEVNNLVGVKYAFCSGFSPYFPDDPLK
jgi:hypothetical protein